MFLTLKYEPIWPASGFRDLTGAREWGEYFTCWYNNEYRHSGLSYVVPAQRYSGGDQKTLKWQDVGYRYRVAQRYIRSVGLAGQ
ncbi:hypothetical protein PSI23_13370 [Xenorhabdus sp. XENO-10]|uniref:Integrase catalytic domain-containing protein n=1 Tax=Xenorhabdus yunnanensis TaxID=3025878 RepID=A0ABT5LGM6_9GAMM|nr:hypothetical protein [Xenorhabdus yunnanensis]MDC9590252.1 hypothetical protein [Xenorhabdus yunnanensis]